MSTIKYEEHRLLIPELPFKLHTQTLQKRGVFAHWHENVEFLYCVEGSCNIQCDSKSIYMKQGDTVVINPLSLHRIETDTCVSYFCLIIKNKFFIENGIKAEHIFFQNLLSDKTAGNLIADIDRVYNDKTTFISDAEKRLTVLAYIIYMCKNYAVRKTNSQFDSKSYAAVLQAVKYINNNFSSKLSLDELSHQVNYSKFHFSRMFKEITGTTVFEHINKLRCENARFLLRNTEKSIYQICFECGFDSPSYFTKTFKSVYKVLPTEYRKSAKEN